MKQTLTTTQAASLLADDENSSFSYHGALALVEVLEQNEEDSGEEIEFCPVAIRCDYSEYESLQAWADDYFGGNDKAREALCIEDEEEAEDAIRKYIERRGILIEFGSGIIVSSF